MKLTLDFTVRDLETGEIVARETEREFPWHGATWIVAPSFEESLRHFIWRKCNNIVRQIVRHQ